MRISKSYGLAWVLATGFLIGCSSQEEPAVRAEKDVSEIFRDMKKLPAIEDPDPAGIGEPDYEEIFDRAYSLKFLDEIKAGEQIPPQLEALLKALNEQALQVSPELKEKFSQVTLDFLVGIVDPRNPLDPRLEELLKAMLASEKLKPLFGEVPVIEGLEELKAAHDGSSLEGNPSNASGTAGLASECALEIYIGFAVGARSCALELENNLRLIEDNYFRRIGEAQERFENRNNKITGFGLEKLPLVVNQFRRILTLIRENSSQEEVAEIRSNLGYLAAAYAYHLRIKAPLWQQYGLELNEWYYYKEMELVAKIRLEKEAEADSAFQYCIDWVNGQIKEEVAKNCPGDEPVLY